MAAGGNDDQPPILHMVAGVMFMQVLVRQRLPRKFAFGENAPGRSARCRSTPRRLAECHEAVGQHAFDAGARHPKRQQAIRRTSSVQSGGVRQPPMLVECPIQRIP